MLKKAQSLKDIDQKNQRIALLEEVLRVQCHKEYGASSEKDVSQGQLFNEAEEDVIADENDTANITVPAHTHARKKRASIPEDLPREDIIHDLSDTEKICPHDGATLKHIGEETSE